MLAVAISNFAGPTGYQVFRTWCRAQISQTVLKRPGDLCAKFFYCFVSALTYLAEGFCLEGQFQLRHHVAQDATPTVV